MSDSDDDGDFRGLSRGQFEVANIIGTSVDKRWPSWKGFWETHADRGWPTKCMIIGCQNDAQYGGHMAVRKQTRDDPRAIDPVHHYILPICPTHNKDYSIECFHETGHSPNFVKTKEAAVLVKMLPNPAVENFVEEKGYIDNLSDYRSRFVNRIHNNDGLDRLMSVDARAQQNFIMFVMDDCQYCSTQFPKFEQHAQKHRTDHIKYYVMHFDDIDWDLIDGVTNADEAGLVGDDVYAPHVVHVTHRGLQDYGTGNFLSRRAAGGRSRRRPAEPPLPRPRIGHRDDAVKGGNGGGAAVPSRDTVESVPRAPKGRTFIYVTSADGRGAMHAEIYCSGADTRLSISKGQKQGRRWCSKCCGDASSSAKLPKGNGSNGGWAAVPSRHTVESVPRAHKGRTFIYVTSADGRGAMHAEIYCSGADTRLSISKGQNQGRRWCSKCCGDGSSSERLPKAAKTRAYAWVTTAAGKGKMHRNKGCYGATHRILVTKGLGQGREWHNCGQ